MTQSKLTVSYDYEKTTLTPEEQIRQLKEENKQLKEKLLETRKELWNIHPKR